MTSKNVDSPDFCPGCFLLLAEVQVHVIQRADGTVELIFCNCGTALDTRSAFPYILEWKGAVKSTSLDVVP